MTVGTPEQHSGLQCVFLMIQDVEEKLQDQVGRQRAGM